MQVICTDGTVFTCQGYALTEYGVKLLDEDQNRDEERYDTEPGLVGYVPHDRLWYIVPDGVRPNGPAGIHPAPQQNVPPQNGPASGGTPPGAPSAPSNGAQGPRQQR